MNATQATSFTCSFALHATCVVGLLFCLTTPFKESATFAPRGICELVSLPAETLKRKGGEPSVPVVQMPDLEKTIPSRDVPPAKTTSVNISERSMEGTPPAASRPVATRLGTQRTTIDEFRRLHGKSASHASSPLPPTTANIRRISAADFVYRGSEAAESLAATEGQLSISERFVSALLTELRRNYTDRDVAFAGLSAQVEFRIAEDGRLQAPRLLSSSGVIEFDRAVLAALQRVKLSDCPPNAVGQVVNARFRVPNS